MLRGGGGGKDPLPPPLEILGNACTNTSLSARVSVISNLQYNNLYRLHPPHRWSGIRALLVSSTHKPYV